MALATLTSRLVPHPEAMQQRYPVPVTRAEALQAGVTVHQLTSPRYQRLFHGLYLPADVQLTVLERSQAALKISPAGSFASHHTAAAIWGGIHAHRARRDARLVQHRGLLLSPPMLAFLETAALRTDLVDLVVLGDSLVKARRLNSEDFRIASSSWVGAGAVLARRAAALIRDGVDSPPETRLRMLIVLAGLPEPAVNFVVRHRGGAWRRRFDLCFPELKLIIEYDGRHHQSDLKQWSSDILRREELEAEGWRIIVVNADALYNHPTGTVHRIAQALSDRGVRSPRTIPAHWHRHFQDRDPLAA